MNDKRVYDNIATILFPFFEKCFVSEIRNVMIPMNQKFKNEIIRDLAPEISFKNYKDQLLITTGLEDKIHDFLIMDITTIKNFPNTYKDRAKYFIKQTRWGEKFDVRHNDKY